MTELIGNVPQSDSEVARCSLTSCRGYYCARHIGVVLVLVVRVLVVRLRVTIACCGYEYAGLSIIRTSSGYTSSDGLYLNKVG